MQKLIYSIVFLFFTSIGYGQDLNFSKRTADGITLPNIVPPSPGVSQMTKYGAVPLNYSTGAVQFGIPIHEIKLGEFTMPISINYSSTGLKVDDVSGNLGMGWTLNAGGIISRIIKGKPDEQSAQYSLDRLLGEKKLYELNKNSNNLDSEQDWFTFNVNGYSGSFYIDQDKNAYVSGDTKVSITCIQSSEAPLQIPDLSNNPMFLSDAHRPLVFILRTPDGAEYEFGGQEYVERNLKASFLLGLTNYGIGSGTPYLNLPEDPQGLIDFSTGFFLRKVTAPNGSKILFKYVDDNYKYLSDLTHNATIEVYPDLTESFAYLESYKSFCRNFVRSKTLNEITVKTIDGFSISKIIVNSSSGMLPIFPELNLDSLGISKYRFGLEWRYSGKATKEILENPFELSSFFWYNPRKIDKLTILDGKNKEIKSVNFLYQYYGNRLFLDAILPTGKLDVKYNFQYKNPEQLPSRLSLAQDYFGYYNGKRQNQGFLKRPAEHPGVSNTFMNSISELFGDREPVADYVDLGLLKKIIYPTKGYTEIQYEPNYGQNQKLYGGARVKSIYDFDGAKITQKRDFYYNKLANYPSLNTSLIDISDPVFFSKITEEQGLTRYGLTSTSMNNIYNTRTSNILYSYVTEFSKDAEQIKGAIEYNFFAAKNPLPAILNKTLILGTPQSNTNDWRNGLKIGEKKFKYEGNNFTLLQHNITEYAIVKEKQFFSNTAVVLDRINRAENVAYAINQYNNYAREYRKIKEKTTEYFGVDSLSKQTLFSYNAVDFQLKESITKSSMGKDVKTSYTYARDIPSPGIAERGLLIKHRINTPLQIERWEGTDKLSTKKMLYKDWGNSLIELEKIQLSIKNNPIEDVVRYYNYDSYGNPIELSRADGIHTVYLWGYNGKHPIAEIKNSDYAAVVLALGGYETLKALNASSPSNTDTLLIGLKEKLPNAQISTYTYAPLRGLIKQTDPKGLSTYYGYDIFQRLRSIKDHQKNIVKLFSYAYAGEGGVDYSQPEGPEWIPPTLKFKTYMSKNQSDMCLPSSPGPRQGVLLTPLFSKSNLEPVSEFENQAVFYSDSALTVLAQTGFYTLFETRDGYVGFKHYSIKDGVLMWSGWCEQNHRPPVLYNYSPTYPLSTTCSSIESWPIRPGYYNTRSIEQLQLTMYADDEFKFTVDDGFYASDGYVLEVFGGVVIKTFQCSAFSQEKKILPGPWKTMVDLSNSDEIFYSANYRYSPNNNNFCNGSLFLVVPVIIYPKYGTHFLLNELNGSQQLLGDGYYKPVDTAESSIQEKSIYKIKNGEIIEILPCQ